MDIKKRLLTGFNITSVGIIILTFIIQWVVENLMENPSLQPLILILGSIAAVVFIVIGQLKISSEKLSSTIIDNIKDDLVEINAYEKQIATEKSKKLYSKELALKVHKAFIATFGTDVNSFQKSLTQKVIGDKNVDPAIDVYEQMGNILDFVGHGLKKDLNDDKYTSWVKDVERKRLKIHFNKSKKEIVRKNINRIKVISYGLNSAIVVRSIIRHLPNNDNVAAMRIGVYIEGLENEGAKILNQMLDQLDLEWKAIGDINLLQIMPK